VAWGVREVREEAFSGEMDRAGGDTSSNLTAEDFEEGGFVVEEEEQGGSCGADLW